MDYIKNLTLAEKQDLLDIVTLRLQVIENQLRELEKQQRFLENELVETAKQIASVASFEI